MRSLTAALIGLALVGGASAEPQGIEILPGQIDNTYRFGGTYQTLLSDSPSACADACSQSKPCKAWSFRKPRADEPAACQLKRTAGMAEHHPGFVSGISPVHEAAFKVDATADLDPKPYPEGRSEKPRIAAPVNRELMGAPYGQQGLATPNWQPASLGGQVRAVAGRSTEDGTQVDLRRNTPVQVREAPSSSPTRYFPNRNTGNGPAEYSVQSPPAQPAPQVPAQMGRD